MLNFYSKKLKFFCIFLLIFLPIIGLTFKISSHNMKTANRLEVNPSISGYPEVDLSFIPETDYSYLNDSWYNPKIEMLIISPNENFSAELNRLMEWKNEKGVKTVILDDFSLYEGVDKAEKIRNMIKTYYEKENIQWVLLAGDAQDDLIPIREVYNPDVIRYQPSTRESVGGENYKPTDLYYADLTGSWDSDGDGNWGEAPQDNSFGLDEISWIPEVYVGRFPANDVNELGIMVNKTLKYEIDPFIGPWLNKMLLAGAISGLTPSVEDEAVLMSYISSNYVQNEMDFTHLHRTVSPYDPPVPPAPNRQEGLTKENIFDEMNLGYSTAIIGSHGYFLNFQDSYGGNILTLQQVNALTNTNMPFLFYGDACTTSSYDINDNSIGEALIKKDNAGAIGVIGSLRVSWYFEEDYSLAALNRGNAKLFWKEFFENKKFQQGRALYDSKVAYINSDYYKIGSQIGDKIIQGSTIYDYERKNLLTYNLLGDPEVDIYTNIPQNASNPFNMSIYEGQLISVIIKDINGKIIPRARVHLESSDGKDYTEYADENGLLKLQLLTQENETYNVTITGHNLKRSSFNFTTIPDNDKPELRKLTRTPKHPFTSDKITFDIDVVDNYSGIESVYLILSKDNFTTFNYYSLSNILLENNDNLAITIDQLFSGDYSFLIYARDYANNTNIFYNDSFRFSIPKPIMDYILPVSLVVIIGITGISSYVLFKGMKKHSLMSRDPESSEVI